MKTIKALRINNGKRMSELILKAIKDKQHLRNNLIILKDKLRDTDYEYFPLSFKKMRNLMSELCKDTEDDNLTHGDFLKYIKSEGLHSFILEIQKFYTKYSNKIFVDIVKELNKNSLQSIRKYKESKTLFRLNTKKVSKINSGSIDLNSNIVKYKDSFIDVQLFTREYKKEKNLTNIRFYFDKEKIIGDGVIKNLVLKLSTNRDVILCITYEEESMENHSGTRIYSLGIDPGVCNHITVSSDNPKSRPLLIKNRAINKITSHTRYSLNRINSEITHLINSRSFGKKLKNLNDLKGYLNDKRNNTMTNEISKINSRIIEYCNKFNIGTIYFGRNIDMKKNNKKMGRKFNKKLMSFPHYSLLNNLKYKCLANGIVLIEQEESYTSKFSCMNSKYDIWNYDYKSNKPTDAVLKEQGVRGKRGLYRDKTSGVSMNSDVNGAFNIMKKGMKVHYTPSIETVTRPIKIKDDFQFLEYLAS